MNEVTCFYNHPYGFFLFNITIIVVHVVFAIVICH